MQTFYGTPAHPGVAIASAARIHTDGGEPSFSPERLRRLGERLRRYNIDSREAEQVIIVAESLTPGVGPLPGIEIAGVAVGGRAQTSPNCPAVSGLGREFWASVSEEDIVIVDGDQGRVYVSPDASIVARYQAPIISARRLFLDSAHLPARRVSNNQTISVFAPAPTRAGVDAAMEGGADGILIPADNDFLGGETVTQTAGEQLAALLDVAAAVGGQPIFLHVPPERLAFSALIRAAAAAPIHLIWDNLAESGDLRAQFRQIEAYLEDEDALFGLAQMEASLSAVGKQALPKTLTDFAGVTVLNAFQGGTETRLTRIGARAHRESKPLTLELSDDWGGGALTRALSLSAAHVIVPAKAVIAVKDAIRAL